MDIVGTKSRVRNTLTNTVTGLAMKLVTLIANFVIRTVFIRYLGMEYTGVSAVFTDILTILSFSELGIGSAITFALYKPMANQDYRQIARLMHLYKTAYRMIAAVIFLGGLALVPFLDRIIADAPSVKEDLKIIFLLYVVNTAVSYLLVYKSTLFTANQQAYILSFLNIGMVIVRTAVQLLVIICFGRFLLYLILTICFTMLQNIMISLKADSQFREIRQHNKERLTPEERRHVFRDSKASALYKISGTVLTGTDSVVISAFLGTGIVGMATNYTMIINGIYALSLPFLNSVTASIGNLAASKDSERQYELFRMMNFVCEWFFCLSTVCLFVLLDEFIGSVWFDEHLLIGFWALLFLCLDFFIKGNTTIVSSFRSANGLFVQGQYRPLIMAVLNIAVSVIAVKAIGLPGVYFGTVLSRAATQLWYDPLILYKHVFKRTAKSYFCEYAVWGILLVSASVISKWINSILVLSVPLLSFLVHALVCVAVVCLFTVIVFGKSNTFHNCISYLCGVVKKTAKRQ